MEDEIRFIDRKDAGKKLAEKLKRFLKDEDIVVYALPRGGVILGVEVARALEAPLDLVVTRKIGHPLDPEYGICAICEDGRMICNESETDIVDKEWILTQAERERDEAKRRYEVYTKGRKPLPVQNKTVILVDDGVATGLNMRLAIQVARRRHPERIIVAVPVVPSDSAEILKQEADELVTLSIPDFFLGAIGAYYDIFEQLTDDEVINLLAELK